MLQFPNINPIALEIGSFAIRWYGLMYLIGFMGAFYYCLKNRKHAYQPWSVDAVADLLFYTALGVIFGGTIGYWLLYEPAEVMADPLNLLKFWQPGRSFHGGLIGVMIAVVIFCKLYRKHFLEVMDFIAPAVPIGLAFGRIGNFINAELWAEPLMFPGA